MSVEETVARWRAEEEAVRARLAATTGYARPDQVDGRTGIKMFEAIFAGKLPRPPIGDTLAGRRVVTAEGRLVGPDGKLYADATTTCLIFDQR